MRGMGPYRRRNRAKWTPLFLDPPPLLTKHALPFRGV